MSKEQKIEHFITSDLPLIEIWNHLLTPDPFPGNLFIDEGTAYVCYPLGTGRIGGYRFEYGNHKWLIIRLTSADISASRIRWDLVDIKSSSLRNFVVTIALDSEEGISRIHIAINFELAIWAKVFGFFIRKKLINKLKTFGISKQLKQKKSKK